MPNQSGKYYENLHLIAHPDSDNFNGAIFNAYIDTAEKMGHEVRSQALRTMDFDPILRKGYKTIQALEPELQKAQENILWCEKWIIIYPIWWGSVPAPLKGFFDRAFYSSFAYKYHYKDPFWTKLLKGRMADIITTCNAPKRWIWWQYRNSDLHMIKNAMLEFCGIKPVRVLRLNNSDIPTPKI